MERSRPTRTAAQNAVYRPCPSCNRKFLSTEIELHANLCIMKQEKTETNKTKASPPKIKNTKPATSNPTQSNYRRKEVPEGLVFYPTEKEFEDPLKYISSLKEIAEPYGVYKIVPPSPPEVWLNNATFEKNVNPDTFFFQTKVQNLRELARRGVSESFLHDLKQFMKERNLPLTKYPKIHNYRIQLHKLYTIVIALGGYQTVCDNHLWSDVITTAFNISPSVPDYADLPLAFQELYKLNLLPYEIENKSASYSLRHSSSSSSSTIEENSSQGMGMRAVKFDPSQYDAYTSTSSSSPSSSSLNKNNDESDEDEDEDDDDDDFGFEQGKVYSLSGFKKQANRFARKYFRIPPGERIDYSNDAAESEFWRGVESKKEDCVVQYGSDLDVQSHGSGFSYESNCNWNLNVLPTLNDSLLRYLSEHVAGITVPMMYVGMLFSCFCWHTEDNYLYSINYLHYGAPKIWYGVGSEYAPLFEEVFKRTYPDLFEKQPDLLHHLTTMLCPEYLLSMGVPVTRLVQNAGEFVVTFPQAYHAGFNSGFNVAEAVNFATVDWIYFGDKCTENYRLVNRSSVFSHHELIYNAILQEENFFILSTLYEEFKRSIINEQEKANELVKSGVNNMVRWESSGRPPHSKSCITCNQECYYYAVSCSCLAPTFSQISCFFHSDNICKNCSKEKLVLLRRYTPEYLEAILQRTKIRLAKFLPKSLTSNINIHNPSNIQNFMANFKNITANFDFSSNPKKIKFDPSTSSSSSSSSSEVMYSSPPKKLCLDHHHHHVNDGNNVEDDDHHHLQSSNSDHSDDTSTFPPIPTMEKPISTN